MTFRVIRWGGLWKGREYSHLLFEDCLPVLRRTRREMRAYIEEKYGYIRKRPDLRAEPHCWKMPVAVRVKIESVGSWQ